MCTLPPFNDVWCVLGGSNKHGDMLAHSAALHL